MTDPEQTLTGQQILDADLADWRLVVGALHARYAAGDFATGLALLDRIGEAAEELNHHPDLDLRYGHVQVRMVSHDAGGVTERDLRLARRITELAAEAGVACSTHEVRVVELGLDSVVHGRIAPFWKAVLGFEEESEGSWNLVDPDGHEPTLWLQETEPHEAPRMRFHYDVHVPHDRAEERVQAALAAGGTLVTDEFAPSWWVLADAEGNKACVCTWQPLGR